jgi:hypothetical protein
MIIGESNNMSLTKHQIFKIGFSQDKSLEIDKITSDRINDFLADPNNIYINHSICILSESVERYGNIENVNRFIIISLIYKDLNETAMDLSTASPVIKQVVRRGVKTDSTIPKPMTETEFDKIVSKIKKNEGEDILEPTQQNGNK